MAKSLAIEHPKILILTARSVVKADIIATEIKKRYPSQDVCTVQMDLSSIDSTRLGAKKVLAIASKIDIIINNAGVMAIPERTLSVDGYELHFATNFLGHFLFTNLLEKKFSSNARIVNVTSGGYMVCPIRFHDLNWDGDKDLPVDEQPDMAMIDALGIGELARPDSYNPMLAYLHSIIVTELQRHVHGFRNQTMEYKTASQGAASLLVAALDPNLQNHPSAYIDDCQKTVIVSDHVCNELVAQRLWKIAQEMTGLTG
ncbi:hypothetical protein NECHADRAFT_87563 [Paecilomyces variotii No. 5]|uniref:Short-chain dehydrogenase n=1 Tax=Byssochlamys spectabilis (strain No. 5 / NBRC 109023) TaxID=1356009 RepID=V5HVN0_BYSSN|nr:hypothetical protein NECHADRAFT_87563 [Paecilomyces variotii No. 5]